MSHVEVSRTINAPPGRLYGLVSDLPRMGEWSPENGGGEWLKGSNGAVVGARFRGRNRIGWRRWSTLATVVTADPGREFAFDVTAGPFKVARWGYRLEQAEGGTRVTESWDDHRSAWFTRISATVTGVRDRASTNRAGMETTLERLAVTATY